MRFADLRNSRLLLLAAHLFLQVVSCSVISTLARANPAPEVLLLTHVHEQSALFCEGLPIDTCEDIVHVTPMMGVLEFDLLIHTLWGWEVECTDMQFVLHWPETWEFVGGEACADSGASISPFAGGASVYIPHLDDAPTAEDLIGIAKIVLDVDSPGELTIGSVSGCGYLEENGARAGTECCSCTRLGTCSHSLLRFPVFDPSDIHVEIVTGTSDSVSLCGYDDGIGSPHTLQYACSDPWMEVFAVEVVDPDCYGNRLTLHLDATALEVGLYSGWLMGFTGDCQECVPVTLSVVDEVHPAVETSTWGHLKSLFLQESR